MKMIKENTIVGFIGTGIMGKSMASHLLEGGYRAMVFTRTKEKAQELLSRGATWAQGVKDIAAHCQVIITMVGFPKDVEEIYLGEGGLLANAKAGCYLVDMTTSSPGLAVKHYEAARAKGMYALDAPVSGGAMGAKEATLAIMVGGDKDAFEAVLPLFELMGKNIALQGAAGSGQHTKMCNQIAMATNMMGVCESMAYAKRSGLDPAKIIKVMEAGSAGSFMLSNQAPRMLAGNYAPGFYVKHFIKDLKIASEAAQEMGLNTPALNLVLKLYEDLADKGEENSGTQALFKLYDQP